MNGWLRSGKHCEEVHQHRVQQGKVDLKHVQADELWVKGVVRKLWMAMALAVPSRLWLGGVISEHRDKPLITRRVERVRSCAQRLDLWVCVDGLQSYVKAFFEGVSKPGIHGSPRKTQGGACQGFSDGPRDQTVCKAAGGGSHTKWFKGPTKPSKRYCKQRAPAKTSTPPLERLNATFRGHLAALVRGGRAIVHKPLTLQGGMLVVGSAYNFCWYQVSLRLQAPAGARYK
jgi:hypothetical protein